MRWQCIEKCYFQGIFYSPQPDGRNIYEGDNPPVHKNGKPMFVCIDPAPVPEVSKDPDPPVRQMTEQEKMKKFMLQTMNKAELQKILKDKYHIEAPDSMIRQKIINLIIEKQNEHPETNQEIAKESGV